MSLHLLYFLSVIVGYVRDLRKKKTFGTTMVLTIGLSWSKLICFSNNIEVIYETSTFDIKIIWFETVSSQAE